jgi:alpha-ketoglutaric semialdehyde dehydrogenase
VKELPISLRQPLNRGPVFPIIYLYKMIMNTRNIIGFSESEGTGNTLQGVNPVTNALIDDKFFIASEEDVGKALAKSELAFTSFKETSNEDRAIFLDKIADEMEALGEVLVKRASLETGLSEARIIGERGRTTGQLRMFANYIREGSYVDASIDTAIPDRAPIPKPDLRKMMVPLGPVVVFGASNFPLAYSVAGGDTAAALAAGCPVLIKAHPGHPGTSALVGSAILKAAKETGMPDGAFSLLFDSGFTVGKALVEHPSTKAVGFTGSIGGGRALFDIAAKRESPIPVFAEMGSINPSILLPQALKYRVQQVANTYAGSITLGAGQFCTNPGLILGIAGDGMNTFVKDLAAAIAKAQPATMLHSGIIQAYRNKTKVMVEQLDVEFVGVAEKEASQSEGQPTLAKAPGSAFLNNPKLHEEVFGPFSLIIECKDKAELEKCCDKLDGQLTVTIIGEDDEFMEYPELIRELREKAGRIIFNGVPTGVEVCPSMVHGGPYPATTDSRFTAVGSQSIKRFLRPVSFQDAPEQILPLALRNENTSKIWRLVNGELNKGSI